MSQTRSPFTLVSSESLSPNTRHFAIKIADGEHFDYIPGQFIRIHFVVDEVELHRSYSIATIPGQTDLIEFAASYVEGGVGTNYLFNLKPGDTLYCSGPYGRLVLKDDEQPKRIILIGTGTGTTPYRCMLPEIEKRLADKNFQLVQLIGAQSPQEFLYAKDFIDFNAKHDNYHLHACFSRVCPEPAASHECKGYVQTRFDSLNLNPEHDVIYLCGNPNMIDEAFAQLKEKGFDAKNVRRERYVSPPAPKQKTANA